MRKLLIEMREIRPGKGSIVGVSDDYRAALVGMLIASMSRVSVRLP